MKKLTLLSTFALLCLMAVPATSSAMWIGYDDYYSYYDNYYDSYYYYPYNHPTCCQYYPDDNYPPPVDIVISNVMITRFGVGCNLVKWTTNVPAKGEITYAPAESYDTGTRFSARNNVLATSQEIRLTGLIPGASYKYQITAEDEDGNSITTDVATFTAGERM